MATTADRGDVTKYHLDRRAATLADLLIAEWGGAFSLTMVISKEGLRPEQVADLLGVSKDFLAKLRMIGQGPKFLQLGPTTIRYRPGDLLEWLETRVATRSIPKPHARGPRRKRAAEGV